MTRPRGHVARTNHGAFLLFGTLLVHLPVTAGAGEAVASDDEDLVLKDFAVPDAPAVTYLGADSSQVEQPGSGRGLLAQLLNNITPDGRVQQGFAVGTDLWYLLPVFAGGSVPEGAFTNPLVYAWSRVQLSLATAKAADADNNTDAAIGLRTTFFDQSDPMLDEELRTAYFAVLSECFNALPIPDTDTIDKAELQKQHAGCMEKRWSATKELVKKLEQRMGRWNANRLSLAAATGVRFIGSRLSGDTRWLGLGTWANGSYNFGTEVLQVILQVRYDYLNQLGAHQASSGARLNLGGDRLNGFAEALYRLGTERAEADLNTGRWAVGAEVHVSSSLWLSASLGSSFATEETPEQLSVFSTLKWALGETRYSPKAAEVGLQ